MDLEKLLELGKELGISGPDLRTWVDEERAKARDQRTADRAAAKEAEEIARARLQEEKTVIELKLKLYEQQARLAPAAVSDPSASTVSSSSSAHGYQSPHKLIPPFNEGRDELDAYIQRFERVANSQGWPADKWALSLSLCLTGEALSAVSRMAADDAVDYAKLKQTLLQRFRYTEEGYRAKFRNSRAENSETGRQFAARLAGYFDHWQQMAKTERTYEDLRDIIISEQFLRRCHEKLAVFLKERGCRGLDKLAETADHYLEAQGLINLGKSKEDKEPGKFAAQSRVPDGQNAKGKIHCFLCNKLGHRAADCWSKTRPTNSKGPTCSKCRKGGHKEDTCPYDAGRGGQASCSMTAESSLRAFETGSTSPSGTSVDTNDENSTKLQVNRMPTADGVLEGQGVTVLRDTGCNSVIVRQSLVPEENLTGKNHVIALLDRSVMRLPEAEISLSSPFLSGRVKVSCMENPLYDVVVGNVEGARDASAPDPDWKRPQNSLGIECTLQRNEVAGRHNQPNSTLESSCDAAAKKSSNEIPVAVVTRTASQAPNPLPVAPISHWQLTPSDLKAKQKDDPTLRRCFETVGSKAITRTAEIEFVLVKGILFRRYKLPSKKEMEQLVVPAPLREFVLKMAHEGILAGHQGTKRTADRVLEEFYWPGVQSDVTRFVKSCDICQRTVPKHLVGRVPLGNMPIVETPFHRVAIDIVGPLSPTSEKGNRYVLTMVDYATRYPDAVALPSIETERVAEALLEMFSRVGIPREIISDRGTSFMSRVMKELSRLLSFEQLPTTPYHPMANGLVERFNGTLKQMIRRMCQESPKNWDRYLAPLLFAYREVPQSSLGFAPFDLLYGRYVRGPMAILKELWTGDHSDSEAMTSYGYVMQLRQRLEDTCRTAEEELKKAKMVQKEYYDRKAKPRRLSVGDKVLLLLPSDANKLILTWKGPFTVLEKRNEVDYVLDLGTRTSLFHINMLKKYEERSTGAPEHSQASVALEGESCEDENLSFLQLQQQETFRDVQLSEEMTEQQKSQVTDLLEAYRGALTDVPGKTHLVQCRLRTTTEAPVQAKHYPIPFAIQETVRKEVEEMLQQEIIERSDSPYQSPVVVVKKKDGAMRLCIDFRQLNQVLVSDNEPIPRVDMIFAKLGSCRYFSKFDFSKGYWQVPMDDDSKGMTAFACASGLYQFRFMPFGIKTAPAVFTRLMRKLVEDLPNIYHYFDDVLIATETWEEHVTVLQSFLERVERAGLTVRPTKSQVGFTSVKFLGHIVGHGLLQPQAETLEKIQAAKLPETKKAVRSFLGLTGYYRDFVPNFSEMAHPLTELTRKKAPNKVVWGKREQEAFEQLKRMLSSQPILKAPDFTKPFVLRTDASSKSVGAVLMQRHDGVLHPVAYASRQLLEREKNYSTIEREGLALVWAVKKFHVFLLGKSFILQCDHEPLAYINSARHVNNRVLRWSLTLMEYEFTVQYIKGSDNVGADYMSRV